MKYYSEQCIMHEVSCMRCRSVWKYTTTYLVSNNSIPNWLRHGIIREDCLKIRLLLPEVELELCSYFIGQINFCGYTSICMGITE